MGVILGTELMGRCLVWCSGGGRDVLYRAGMGDIFAASGLNRDSGVWGREERSILLCINQLWVILAVFNRRDNTPTGEVRVLRR